VPNTFPLIIVPNQKEEETVSDVSVSELMYNLVLTFLSDSSTLSSFSLFPTLASYFVFYFFPNFPFPLSFSYFALSPSHQNYRRREREYFIDVRINMSTVEQQAIREVEEFGESFTPLSFFLVPCPFSLFLQLGIGDRRALFFLHLPHFLPSFLTYVRNRVYR
jgi:hypothetical protein